MEPQLYNDNPVKMQNEVVQRSTQIFVKKCCNVYEEFYAAIGDLSIDTLLDEIGDALSDIQCEHDLMSDTDYDIDCDSDMEKRSKDSDSTAGSFIDDTAIQPCLCDGDQDYSSDDGTSKDDMNGPWYEKESECLDLAK